MKNDNTRKIIVGAILVGAVGYAVGVLTAPKSGRETREDIKKTINKAMLEAEKQLKSLYSELTVLLAQAREKAGVYKGKGKEEFDELVEQAAEAKESAREIISAIHEGDATDPDLDAAIKNAQDAANSLRKYLRRAKD